MFSAIAASGFRVRLLFSLVFVGAGTFGFHDIHDAIVRLLPCRNSQDVCVLFSHGSSLYLRSAFLLIGAAIFVLAAFRRLRATLSLCWLPFVFALLFAFFPLLSGMGNFWGANYIGGVLWLSRVEVLLLMPLIIFAVMLSLDLERKPGLKNGLLAFRAPGRLPLGAIYGLTALWFSAPFLALFGSYFLEPSERFGMTFDLISSPWLNGTIAAEINALVGLVIALFLLFEKPDGSLTD